jgi:tyrosine-protein kinase Etk/Wzc
MFDLVLVDTAPCLVAADSAVIALTTQAEVLLVVQAGRTRRSAIMKAKEEFEKIRRPIRGLILNQVDLSEEYSDYGSLERPSRSNPRRKSAVQPVRVVTPVNERR